LIGITVETLDDINKGLAFGEYLLEIDSIIYAERNEYIVKYSIANNQLQTQLQISQAKTEIMESLQKKIALRDEDKEDLKVKLRRARWRGWRDRIILVGIIVVETIIIVNK
jgi:hypothetical protein